MTCARAWLCGGEKPWGEKVFLACYNDNGYIWCELFFIIKIYWNIVKNIYLTIIFSLNDKNWHFYYLWLTDMKMID